MANTQSEEEVEEQVKSERMRKYLVMNLFDSEKCYADCLEMIVKVRQFSCLCFGNIR